MVDSYTAAEGTVSSTHSSLREPCWPSGGTESRQVQAYGSIFIQHRPVGQPMHDSRRNSSCSQKGNRGDVRGFWNVLSLYLATCSPDMFSS